MRTVRLLASAAIAATTSVALASPAHAATVELDAAHRNVLARAVTQSCAEGTDQLDPRMSARAADQDGWFFEVGAGTIVSLSVTFAPAGIADSDPAGQVVVTGAAAEPESVIVFHRAGPFTPHAYVFVPAGWLLVTATAEIERGSRLILRHACAGEPATAPTPIPSPSPPPDGSPAPAPGPSPSGSPPPGHQPGPGGPKLVVTGAQVGGMVVLGTGLLAAGVAMMAVRRRRAIADLFDD
jgi:hypothetical protein